MYLLDACLNLSSVYCQYVNGRAARVKIDRDSVVVDLGYSNSQISLVRWFSTTWALLMKMKRLLEYKGDFVVFL